MQPDVGYCRPNCTWKAAVRGRAGPFKPLPNTSNALLELHLFARTNPVLAKVACTPSFFATYNSCYDLPQSALVSSPLGILGGERRLPTSRVHCRYEWPVRQSNTKKALSATRSRRSWSHVPAQEVVWCRYETALRRDRVKVEDRWTANHPCGRSVVTTIPDGANRMLGLSSTQLALLKSDIKIPPNFFPNKYGLLSRSQKQRSCTPAVALPLSNPQIVC